MTYFESVKKNKQSLAWYTCLTFLFSLLLKSASGHNHQQWVLDIIASPFAATLAISVACATVTFSLFSTIRWASGD